MAVADFVPGQSEVNRKYADDHKKEYNEEYDSTSAWTCDGLNVLVGATKKAGENRAKIREAILGTKGYRGVQGAFSFTSNGDGLSEVSIVQIDKGKPKLPKGTGLAKHFGGLKAVDGVDMEVRRGEIHALIGPNGSGKTTILIMLSGLYIPTAGDIILEGANMTGRRPHVITAHGVARTFQNIRQFGGLTVLDNVMIGQHSQSKAGLIPSVLQPSPQQAEEAPCGRRPWIYWSSSACVERSSPRPGASRTGVSVFWSWRGRSSPIQSSSCWMNRRPG